MKKSTFICICISLAFSGILHAQQWQQKADVPFDGRHHPITWSINGVGYLLGGTSGNTVATAARKDFHSYDPATDSWTQLSDYPGPGRAFSISATYQDKAYVGFGATVVGTSYQALNDLWSYDPQTDTWTQLADCPCAGRLHPTFTINQQYGKLYVGKGNNSSSNLKDWWEYDIATDTWTAKTNFPGTARHHPYHFSIGQYTYSGFGHDGGPTMAREDWYRYDPATDTWDQMADAPDGVGRIAGQQFTYNGYGFVIDGDGAHHQSTNPSIFWRYDPATNTWDQLTPHPGNSIWAPGLFVINGTAYLIGGSQNQQNAPFYTSVWATDLDALNTSKFTEQSIGVYPNPAHDVLHISSLSDMENTHFSIYSLEGKLLMDNKTGEQIDVSNLSSGMYIIKLTDGTSGNTQHIRFVKR